MKNTHMNKNKNKLLLKTTIKKKRKVHPLQYIPVIKLDQRCEIPAAIFHSVSSFTIIFKIRWIFAFISMKEGNKGRRCFIFVLFGGRGSSHTLWIFILHYCENWDRAWRWKLWVIDTGIGAIRGIWRPWNDYKNVGRILPEALNTNFKDCALFARLSVLTWKVTKL